MFTDRSTGGVSDSELSKLFLRNITSSKALIRSMLIGESCKSDVPAASGELGAEFGERGLYGLEEVFLEIEIKRYLIKKYIIRIKNIYKLISAWTKEVSGEFPVDPSLMTIPL